MATIESEAYFDARLATIRVSAPTIAKMKTRGWSTLGDFAYASSYVPGQGADTAFCTGVLEVLLGDTYADSPDAPKLRRLYFESHTLSVADLRRRTESTDNDQPIKLPAEERIVRLARLRTRFPGMDIDGVYAPSHSLVDLLTQMLETNQIRYVPWSACTCRDQEVLGVKKVSIGTDSIVPDAAGYYRRQNAQEEHVADVTNDLLLSHALTRRAFAFELANICRYESFSALTTKFFREYMRPALHKYCRVTMEQVENCDRFVFTELAMRTAGRVGVRPDGTFPVEVALRQIMDSSEFSFLLMQMPAGGNAAKTRSEPSVKGAKRSSRSRSRRRRITEEQESNRQRNASDGRAKKPKSKAKGQSKGRGKSSSKGPAPFNPATETGRTADGFAICYAYNTNGCSLAAPGERCIKGFHVCWKIGCGRAHASNSHTASQS